jgi:hypothetical protein
MLGVDSLVLWFCIPHMAQLDELLGDAGLEDDQ